MDQQSPLDPKSDFFRVEGHAGVIKYLVPEYDEQSRETLACITFRDGYRGSGFGQYCAMER